MERGKLADAKRSTKRNIKTAKKSTAKAIAATETKTKSKKKIEFSNAEAGMNWWNFHIENMTVPQRYLFIGLVLIIPTLVGFFAGLAIDFALQQEATLALWGLGIGAIAALTMTWIQLKKLV
ncbi:MAG: hypothetical protein Q4C83_03270 [Candidatus Saccharibacteria bacterium]|nr:hypothetical protein [Candidatus Saccharibacteria bacterium]